MSQNLVEATPAASVELPMKDHQLKIFEDAGAEPLTTHSAIQEALYIGKIKTINQNLHSISFKVIRISQFTSPFFAHLRILIYLI